MRDMLRPTIYALSTHPGRAAIGVIRVSGPHAQTVYSQLTRAQKPPPPRRAQATTLYGPRGVLDHALTLFLKGPHTYTGEDTLELHVHGGTAIVKAVLAAVLAVHRPGDGVVVRHAENGEFLKRAFLNGRLDLTEAEGVRTMIDAETELQRQAAVAALTGGNKTVARHWRQTLVHQMALLTTVIDFGEEHDVAETDALLGDVAAAVSQLRADVYGHLDRARRTELLVQGLKVTLVGPVNAGKLSLVNRMARLELAIVSDEPGTTRDVVEAPLDMAGFKVVVGDTAGLRLARQAGTIEQEGMRRARERAQLGDVAVVVVPLALAPLAEIVEQVRVLVEAGKPLLVAANKMDLVTESAKAGAAKDLSDELLAGEVKTLPVGISASEGHEQSADGYLALRSGRTLFDRTDMAEAPAQHSHHLVAHYTLALAQALGVPAASVVPVLCKTGAGLESLEHALVALFETASTSDPVLLLARARDLLEHDVLYGLDEFAVWADAGDVVAASECLRQAVEGIGKITGDAVGIEEILGVVFSSFCIGK